MPVFVVPRLYTYQLNSSDARAVRNTASTAFANADSDAKELLREQAFWAYDALSNNNLGLKATVAALRCLEVCELESARQTAVKSTLYGMWSTGLDFNVTVAMEATLDPNDPDREQRRTIVSGLRTLIGWERQLDRENDRSTPTQPTSNRSKGKRSRRGKGHSLAGAAKQK